MRKILLALSIIMFIGCSAQAVNQSPQKVYKITLWGGHKPVKTYKTNWHGYWSERPVIYFTDINTGKKVELMGVVSVEEE